MKKVIINVLVGLAVIALLVGLLPLRNVWMGSRLERNWKDYNTRGRLPLGFEWVQDDMGEKHAGFYAWPLGPYIYRDKNTGEEWGSEG